MQAKQQHNQSKPKSVTKKRDEKFRNKQREADDADKPKFKQAKREFNSDEEIDSAEADSVHEMPVSATVNPTEKSIERLVKPAASEKVAKKSVKFSKDKSDDPIIAKEEVSISPSNPL